MCESMLTSTRLLLLAVGTFMLVAAERTLASHWRGAVDVDILSEQGDRFPTYPVAARSGGAVLRTYLEAHDQARYRIRVHNRGGTRVGLVIAVDGRNIISGGRSELARGESMYILDPWESATYQGWRTSEDEVHEFYFTDWKNSYAEALGDRSARGVIAVAVYRERAQALTFEDRAAARDAERRAASPPSSTTTRDGDLARSESEPGTGFGGEIHSPVRRVAFDSERSPVLRYFIKYEWRDSLCRKRVIECGPREWNRFWDEGRLGFAPYPPGR